LFLQHYSTAGADDAEADQLDVTFTATTAADGTLLVGSSRDVSWDQAAPDGATVAAMLGRAQDFLPALAAVEPEAIRVGLRPQVPASCFGREQCDCVSYECLKHLQNKFTPPMQTAQWQHARGPQQGNCCRTPVCWLTWSMARTLSTSDLV